MTPAEIAASRPPDREKVFPFEIDWDNWDPNAIYFNPRTEQWQKVPPPIGEKVLQYWDQPDGTTIGRWFWRNRR